MIHRLIDVLCICHFIAGMILTAGADGAGNVAGLMVAVCYCFIMTALFSALSMQTA